MSAEKEYLESALKDGWRCCCCQPPNFQVMGFHTGRKVDVVRGDGHMSESVLYHGHDVYGAAPGDMWTDVKLWRPSQVTGGGRE